MQTTLFDAETAIVPGLVVTPEWISEAEELELVRNADAAQWLPTLARRVQHYGWRYDYRSRRVAADDYLGPLPKWMTELADRLRSEIGMIPDQAIVNEYEPGQGIASHTDCVPCFGPVVAMVSTLSNIQMDFRHSVDGTTTAVVLPRRSLLVLAGPARLEWTHAIAKRRTDAEFDITRGRRISLTFRTIVTSK